jgi:hypothetical protein
MKPTILLLALITVTIVFSNCSTAYKTGQTPDDVYYSPARPQDEYVRVNNNDDQKYYGDNYYDDRYLRMKVHDPLLWSDLNDWYYYGDRYNYGYNYFTNYDLYLWNNPWSPYTYWNSYYNPYYRNYVVFNPKTSYVYTAPRTVNLNTFNNRRLLDQNYNNTKTFNLNNVSNRFNSGNTNRNTGSFLRNIFSGGGNNNSNTSSGSSGSSSGSSGSKSSSAPVRKF